MIETKSTSSIRLTSQSIHTVQRCKAVCRFLLLISAITTLQAAHIQSLDISDQRELFVDRFLIDHMDGLELRLETPVDQGPVLKFDAPWEGRFSAYATVLKDDDRYRLYYRGIPTAGSDGQEAEVTCYAESADGIHWVKPELGIHSVHGTKQNNVILADDAPVTHNFCPFIDRNPDAPQNQRYKALGGIASSGLFAYVSSDGVHWKRLQSEAVFQPEGWVLDSQNVAFWSELEQQYVLHYRSSVDGIRAVAKTTSTDFLNWTKPQQMSYSDTGTARPSQHLYTNQTHPYFRAPHIYLGTAARFLPRRQVLNAEQAQAINAHPKYFRDTSDSVLITTRGTLSYDRSFLGALIKPGIGAMNWVSRSNYPALNIVPTGPTEMSLFVNQNYGQPTAHLRRYSFRLDGIAGLHAPFHGGTWTSKPLRFKGSKLFLNFATSAAGGIRVALQDAEGQVFKGFSLADAQEVIGNEIERAVHWKSDQSLAELQQPVRIHMEMKDAILYSLRFGTE